VHATIVHSPVAAVCNYRGLADTRLDRVFLSTRKIRRFVGCTEAFVGAPF